MAIAGAAAAFADREYFEQTRQAVIAERDALVDKLDALGFEVLPSAANFVFATHPGTDAGWLSAQLRERGVIVRHFRLPRIEQFLRITIGAPAQNVALVEALGEILD
jgi:histidinol-phosphate aminotransferase